jgi:hypothetical protein
MSQAYINQLTINCLVNKDMSNKHVDKKKLKKEEKEEIKFYRKRTYNLFKEIINGVSPEDLLPDVKYAYDNFVKASIHYFKTIDNNDIIQAEYADLDKSLNNYGENNYVLDVSGSNIQNVVEADKLLMRSVKVDLPPTLDKYITKTIIQKREADLILPKQKEINLLDPQFQTKGLK